MPPTDQEQFLLELINDARLNPLGDAGRYLSSYSPLTATQPDIQSALDQFDVSGTDLAHAFAALAPAQPLAWNDRLATASRQHDDAMIAAGTQSHQLPGEADFATRNATAGYTGMTEGAENVFAYADDVLYAHAGFMVDWGNSTPGHRDNIMDPNLREIGIGIEPASGALGPLVVTEDFGSRGTGGSFVLGLAYTDADGSGFYSVGEGRADLVVSLGADTATSGTSGGYTLATAAAGAQTVTLSGGGLAAPVGVGLDLGTGSNVKLDVVNGTTLRASVSVTVSGPISRIEGLGVTGLAITAGAGAQTLIGTPGNDTLRGGLDNDELHGALGNDMLYGGAGDDLLFAGQGNDQLRGGLDNDELHGGRGNDLLYGGAGNDRLFGGQGDDTLTGGAGDDSLTGGIGANRFIFGINSGNDQILGFNGAAGDRLDLQGQTASTGTAGDGSALLTLSGGGTIDLVGLTPDQINAGLFA